MCVVVDENREIEIEIAIVPASGVSSEDVK
jgi:hypothetical protein